MKTYFVADPTRYARMTTAELRETFLIDGLFASGQITLNYIDLDRTVAGSAVPTNQPLTLISDDSLRSKFFTERRELGILNIGQRGSVKVADKTYDMDRLDCLYVGCGNPEISFTSDNAANPAQFYLLSYPAHQNYPTVLARKADAAAVNLGSETTVNKRTIYKYIHPDGIKSCQLVMGFTQLVVGSAWNTMPPHTHLRRSEVYLYFDLPPEHRVFHMMGPGHETRHLVMAEKQLAISPAWSIHAGVGTTNYSFCWGMGGENQVFDDMDGLPIATLL